MTTKLSVLGREYEVCFDEDTPTDFQEFELLVEACEAINNHIEIFDNYEELSMFAHILYGTLKDNELM